MKRAIEFVSVLPVRSNVSPKGKVIPLDGLDENHLTRSFVVLAARPRKQR